MISDDPRPCKGPFDFFHSALSVFRRDPVQLPEYDFGTVFPTTPFEKLERAAKTNGVDLYDYRDLDVFPRKAEYDTDQWGYPSNKKRAHPFGKRSWTKTSAILLHTYAVKGMGAHRFLGVPAHCGLADDGSPVLMHELWRLLAHGHAGNSFSVGLEVSGYCDFDSDKQIAMGRALIAYIFGERRRHVGDLPMAIMTHRQSRRSRALDPGERIWRELGEWAIDVLGMVPGPVVGTGQSIDGWRGSWAA